MSQLSVADGEAALLLRAAVPGAPIRVGCRVEVVVPDDDSADPRFAGQLGEVTGLLYDDPLTQLPHAPLVIVQVEGLGEELFFSTELRPVPVCVCN